MSKENNQPCKVKICGITNVIDACYAAQSGADAIGMVFYEPSPRHVSDLGLAAEIATELGPFTQLIGLFVDADVAYIERVLKTVAINCLQFHGNENAAYCEQFAHPYIKALRMKNDLDVIETSAQYISARGILLDSYVKGVPGGTGETFNWQRVPKGMENLILAGGLRPENVADAVQQVRPYAVDVSGGVEKAPGKKDLAKVKAFIQNAKSGAVSE